MTSRGNPKVKNVVLSGWIPGHLRNQVRQLLQLNNINVVVSCPPAISRKLSLKRFEIPDQIIKNALDIRIQPATFKAILAETRGDLRNYVAHELLCVSGYSGYSGADMLLYGLKPKQFEGYPSYILAQAIQVSHYNILNPGVLGNILEYLRDGHHT